MAASSPQIIPLTSAPNQTLTVSVAINGTQVTLKLRVTFNAQAGYWVMDVSDQLGNPLVLSVPLITGVWPAANVLSAFEYLGIGSAYVINQDGAQTDWPNATQLGVDFNVVWDSNS